MQELRLVAVSEDGTYAVLAVPGRGGRFSLPIDDRLRTVARGQFSRLAQYEIEVENPLRPKEIQDRIRAGETAEEIADAAGIPIDRVRRFEGPVLAEREYRAQEAQRSTVRGHTESGPGPRLGEIVLERLAEAGAPTESLAWDSRKRTDGNWQVQLRFMVDGREQAAEWVFDPRRRQVMPADDLASRLCLPQVEWPAGRLGSLGQPTATVTPIGSRREAPHGDGRSEPERIAARGAHPAHLAQSGQAGPSGAAGQSATRSGAAAPHRQDPAAAREAGQRAEPGRVREPAAASGRETPAASRPGKYAAPAQPGQPAHQAQGVPAAQAGPATAGGRDGQPGADDAAASATGTAETSAATGTTGAADSPAAETAEGKPQGRRKAARGRRSSVPSWDEIMLGTSRQPD
jgi:hypothetical protein